MGNPEPTSEYVLAGNTSELERLRLQARVWEPAGERMLDAIRVAPGWRCVDLGSGPVGIVKALSHRVGPTGHVTATDIDAKHIETLRDYAASNGLTNVSVVRDDAYNSRLQPSSFDFVHVRYVFSPVGRAAHLLSSLISLCRGGGIVAAEETIASTWACYPTSQPWNDLRDLIIRAFLARGGDFDSGKLLYSMFRNAGLKEIGIRAEVLCPLPDDPYRRIPLMFATALRSFMLERQLISAPELDRLVAACEPIAADPNRFHMTFTTAQVWGRKPVA
jgi:ubiquinone/menaquinone biosynthesis C-methylase UbiE